MELYKVFIVEDESIVREGLRDMIPWEQYGFVFAGEAPDGEIALPMLRRLRPDILITDIKMPFMDGLALTRMVNRELPETRVIILSGYDDFEYARQAIELRVDQYLLKPITRAGMIKALEQTRARIEEEKEQSEYLRRFTLEGRQYEDYSRQGFFEKLVNGSMSVQEIHEQAEALDIELDAETYNFILCSLLPQETGLSYSEDIAALEESLLEYFLQFPDLLFFRSSMQSRAVLLKARADQLQELTERCTEAIAQRCRACRTPLDWYVAIGTPTSRLSGLPGCYSSAGHVLAFRHLMPRRHILTSEIVGHIQKSEKLSDAVDTGKVDPLLIRSFAQSGLLSEIDDFVAQFFTDLDEALQSMMFRHYLILSIRINVLSAIQELDLNRDALAALLPPVQPDTSPEELRAYLDEMLRAAVSFREEESRRRGSDLVDSAISYIDRNFTDENISLNTVARAVNASTNYLSALFSQKVGLSFVEYLTKKRMDLAKQLLRQGDRRSSEVALAVGYKDPHYFSFVFKKTQGCTPREYRSGEREK